MKWDQGVHGGMSAFDGALVLPQEANPQAQGCTEAPSPSEAECHNPILWVRKGRGSTAYPTSHRPAAERELFLESCPVPRRRLHELAHCPPVIRSCSLVPGSVSFSLPDAFSTTTWPVAAQRKQAAQNHILLGGAPPDWPFVEGVYPLQTSVSGLGHFCSPSCVECGG